MFSLLVLYSANFIFFGWVSFHVCGCADIEDENNNQYLETKMRYTDCMNCTYDPFRLIVLV